MAPLVYLCCHPTDDAAKAALLIHLRPLARAGVLALAPEPEAGDDVAEHRGQQLAQADVLLVVLSPHWLADPQRCDDARRFVRDRPVLPLLYRACDWDLPPSPVAGRELLGPRAPILTAPPGLSDDAFLQVTRALRAHLQRPPAVGPLGAHQPAPLVGGPGAPPRRPHTLGWAMTLARELDRDPQWRALKAHLATRRSGLVLLSGHERHYLALFAARVVHRLQREVKPPPKVASVRPYGERLVPHSAAEWESRLVEALHKDHPGPPSRVLQRAAAHAPLFLLLDQTPLQRHRLRSSDNSDCTPALTTFLGVTLPRLLKSAPPPQPVQLLIMAEYESRGEQRLIADLRAALDLAAHSGLPTCVLDEPTTPTVADLRKVLERYGLAEHLRDDLCTSYARLLEDNDEPHLRKLIDIIDRVPESEFADPRPPTAPDDRDDEEDPA